jgi:hypothetical protein
MEGIRGNSLVDLHDELAEIAGFVNDGIGTKIDGLEFFFFFDEPAQHDHTRGVPIMGALNTFE